MTLLSVRSGSTTPVRNETSIALFSSSLLSDLVVVVFSVVISNFSIVVIVAVIMAGIIREVVVMGTGVKVVVLTDVDDIVSIMRDVVVMGTVVKAVVIRDVDAMVGAVMGVVAIAVAFSGALDGWLDVVTSSQPEVVSSSLLDDEVWRSRGAPLLTSTSSCWVVVLDKASVAVIPLLTSSNVVFVVMLSLMVRKILVVVWGLRVVTVAEDVPDCMRTSFDVMLEMLGAVVCS